MKKENLPIAQTLSKELHLIEQMLKGSCDHNFYGYFLRTLNGEEEKSFKELLKKFASTREKQLELL